MTNKEKIVVCMNTDGETGIIDGEPVKCRSGGCNKCPARKEIPTLPTPPDISYREEKIIDLINRVQA